MLERVGRLGRRVGAALLDGVLVLVVVLAGAEVLWRAGVLGWVGVSTEGWVAWSWSFPRVGWTVAVVVLVYQAGCTALWQASVGKRLFGLRVVTVDGGRPGPGVALWRSAWTAAMFAPSLVAVVLLLGVWVAAGDVEQRSLGDRAAGTRVVRAVGRSGRGSVS